MTTEHALETATRVAVPAALQEKVLLNGDLSALTPGERLVYYNAVCESLGLNPLTQPFQYLNLDGKLVLYARRDCTEQLRKIESVSIDPDRFTTKVIEGIYIVTAVATVPSGRTDVSTGAVAIDKLSGQFKANAMMKAETKAKRRVTLSICGLGMLDETEVDTIPGQPQPGVVVDDQPKDGDDQPKDLLPPGSGDPPDDAADYHNQIDLAESVKEVAATLNAMEKDARISRENKQTLRVLGKQKMGTFGKSP